MGRRRNPRLPPALSDPTDLAFPASVAEIRPNGVVLSQSRFLPQSGERQSDAGWLGPLAVSAVVRDRDGELVHEVPGGHHLDHLEVGQPVTAMIDVRRRATLSRLHSALHLLYFGYQATHGPTRRLGRRVTIVSARLEVLQPASLIGRLSPVDAAGLASWVADAIAADTPIVRFQGADPDRVYWYGQGVGSLVCAGLHPPSTGAIGALRLTVEQLDVDRLTLSARLQPA